MLYANLAWHKNWGKMQLGQNFGYQIQTFLCGSIFILISCWPVKLEFLTFSIGSVNYKRFDNKGLWNVLLNIFTQGYSNKFNCRLLKWFIHSLYVESGKERCNRKVNLLLWDQGLANLTIHVNIKLGRGSREVKQLTTRLKNVNRCLRLKFIKSFNPDYETIPQNTRTMDGMTDFSWFNIFMNILIILTG